MDDKKKTSRPLGFYVVSIGVLAAAAGGVYYIHKSRNIEIGTVREARAAIAERGPRIEIVNATASPTERSIKLLGDVRSGATTTLYAKVAGYLKTIAVDKGDRVDAGQVIAQIESPNWSSNTPARPPISPTSAAILRASRNCSPRGSRRRSRLTSRRPTRPSPKILSARWRRRRRTRRCGRRLAAVSPRASSIPAR